MIVVSVKEAVKTLQSALTQLSPKQFATGVSRAINETIMQGRTEARSSVKAIYNIPQRYVAGININKATSVSLIANLFASAKPIPMDAFSPKFETADRTISISRKGIQKEKSLKKKKNNPGVGVSIEVYKGKREVIPYAFLIPGAKPRVFARGEYKSGTSYGFVQRNQRANKDGADTPIKPLISVTVHAAVINKESLQRIESRVTTVFPVSIERNISFLLSRVST